jgi:hypothetical protein
VRTWAWWSSRSSRAGDGGGVAEQLAPILHRAIRGEQRGGPFVAAHDDFQEVLGGGGWESTHAEVVDDEQRDGGELREGGLAGAGELGVGELVDEGVGFAVEDAVALLDDGHTDGLGEMALAGAEQSSHILRSFTAASSSTIAGIRSSVRA